MRAKYDMEMQFVIEGSDSWEDSCKLDQVMKQAQDDASRYQVWISDRQLNLDQMEAMKALGLKLVNKRLKVTQVKVGND